MQIALKLKLVLQIVKFAQNTQINNGTIFKRVNLKRHLFSLQIVLKLKTVLKIVQFAQITQLDNGTILQRVYLKDIS